jgi:hypothetical protein
MTRRLLIGIVTVMTVLAVLVIARQRRELATAERLQDRYPEVAAARALLRARNDSLQAYGIAQQRAEARAAIASLRPGPGAFALETRGRVSAGTRAAFLAAFEDELAAIPEPQVPIRALLIADSARVPMNYGMWYRRPQREGDACVIVIKIGERPTETITPSTRIRRLGVCGFYARAGMPGPGIAAWLDSTRVAAALTDAAQSPGPGADISEQLRGAQVTRFLAPVSCVAGHDAACLEAVLTPLPERRVLPRVSADQAPDLVSAYGFEMDGYPGDATAQLRVALGDAQFAAWWRSALGPAEAYERLTGRPFARFARAYFEPYLGQRRPGPLRAGLPLVLGLLLAAAAASATIRYARRARS